MMLGVQVLMCIVFVLIIPSFIFLCFRTVDSTKAKNTLPTNWPVLGMIPGLLSNFDRVHEYMTDVLHQSNGTFLFKGPVFSNMEMLLTCDPANVNYVLTRNFSNFSKGPEFKKIFEVWGEGIFVAESDLWESQRRISKSVMGHAGFLEFVAMATWRKMEAGLVPILEVVSDQGIEVDLQELFQRFTFDLTCAVVLGYDPASLCKELPESRYLKAFADIEEALLYRHILPEVVWKMQKWLQIGQEKKMSQSMEAIDELLLYCGNRMPAEDFNILTSCNKVVTEKGGPTNVSEKVLKDLMLNLIFAGKDTISSALCWFFWLLATNPTEEEKILNEIAANSEPGLKWNLSKMDVLNKLIYLHGAMCETFRLFPPVPLQHKAPLEHDILPSGHRIKPNAKTILAFYSMGRMDSIWGKDCLEFKPGRWISESGRLKVEPSYKFTAFNAGPRSCLGKELSFIQTKIAAAAMVSRFRIQVVEGHPIQPSNSVILHMKHGLRVKVSRRL